MEDKRAKQLEWLKDRLKNISPSNRSLRLTAMPKRRVFSLEELNQFQPFIANEIITNILKSPNSKVSLLPVFSPEIKDGDEEPIGLTLSKHLTTLNREVQFLIRDKGDAYFNLGYPFIEFHTNNDMYFRAPLVLTPCKLFKDTNKSRPDWKLEIEDIPTINELVFDVLVKNDNAKFPDNFLNNFLDCSISELITRSIKVYFSRTFSNNSNSLTCIM